MGFPAATLNKRIKKKNKTKNSTCNGAETWNPVHYVQHITAKLVKLVKELKYNSPSMGYCTLLSGGAAMHRYNFLYHFIKRFKNSTTVIHVQVYCFIMHFI
jgi:hypothetical protein